MNPVRPSNIVAAWIQGPFQNIVAAASFDGGQTWQRVPVPLTTCAGGQFLIAGDVWLSFAPDGILYGIAVSGNALSSLLPEVLKSTDGGLHWAASVPPAAAEAGPEAADVVDPQVVQRRRARVRPAEARALWPRPA